jgi:hypothetical protein
MREMVDKVDVVERDDRPEGCEGKRRILGRLEGKECRVGARVECECQKRVQFIGINYLTGGLHPNRIDLIRRQNDVM